MMRPMDIGYASLLFFPHIYEVIIALFSTIASILRLHKSSIFPKNMKIIISAFFASGTKGHNSYV
jgi:hypothetical protein